MSGPDWGLLSSYAGLLTLACGSVYAGSFGSLPNAKLADGSPADEDDEEEIVERVSSEDAWLFPVLGSAALFGLYTVIRYFGREWINWFLGCYFSLTGVMSVWKTSVSLARLLLGPTRWKQYDKTSIVIKKGSTSLFSLSLRTPSLLLFPLAMVPSAIYSFSKAAHKPVLITDILSLSFSHAALSLMKIDSFQTGVVLLLGLFFYDIWWVFGTKVMVEVATTLDVPIKLLWPKSLTFSDARGFTMLGLGDVVVPGTFIAFALRFDYHRALQSKANLQRSFAKPYFYSALTAYFLGLVTTVSVLHVFETAQPALLYLSPACIASFFLTAFIRGEFREAWKWSDNLHSPKVAAAEEKKTN
ncbi:putative presenilin, signal peptide peptidase, family protein [Lyophyllum shimeji]|uniref:Presenilin, signal peptide peptidase, family protein n=1 Tax=Lyophyllum shimeji TaxID=47721 RepID=A0A9P3PKQ1_LYOSH|nr:putative presenilin, signal peptide peptidase, family protein [Lyophyllum shimeji]